MEELFDKIREKVASKDNVIASQKTKIDKLEFEVNALKKDTNRLETELAEERRRWDKLQGLFKKEGVMK